MVRTGRVGIEYFYFVLFERSELQNKKVNTSSYKPSLPKKGTTRVPFDTKLKQEPSSYFSNSWITGRP